MASISVNVPSLSIREWATDKFQAFQTFRAQRAMYKTTIKELSALSNRELSDLGIARSGIRAIALEAFDTV